MTDEATVAAMVEEARWRFGTVHILVNNAGTSRNAMFARVSLDDFRLVVDLHLMGSVVRTRTVWGIMREQDHGRIVMTKGQADAVAR